MHNFCKIVMICCLVGFVLSLSACAKVAPPAPYEDSGYPHSYPIN